MSIFHEKPTVSVVKVGNHYTRIYSYPPTTRFRRWWSVSRDTVLICCGILMLGVACAALFSCGVLI